MSKWHGGKGSNQRPTDQKKFSDNWDRIFSGKKVEHGSSTDNIGPDRGTDNKDRKAVKG